MKVLLEKLLEREPPLEKLGTGGRVSKTDF